MTCVYTRYISSCRKDQDGYNHIEFNLKETEQMIKATTKSLRIIQYIT